MTNQSEKKPLRAYRNWISMGGLLLASGSLFAFILLWVFDQMDVDRSPYFGILTYIVSPSFLLAGIGLFFAGWIFNRKRLLKAKMGAELEPLVIDLSRAKDRKFLFIFGAVSAVFLLLTAIGSYQSYHVTKSVKFCGETCHTVMEPQFVAHQRSAHAKVECVACHISPGAAGFVEAKLGGLHQVYGTIRNDFKRPLDVRDKIHVDHKTCEGCHWPQKYHGRIERTYTHYLSDKENTPYVVRLSLNVGGADPTQGPVGGVHWHMHLSTKVEYIATDKDKQKIPWVRLTDADGKVTEFKRPDFKDDIAKYKIQTMSCMDCHNRPAHQFAAPTDAIDKAITLGRIDHGIPDIKKQAVLALTTTKMSSGEEDLANIAKRLQTKYPNDPRMDATIKVVQDIYRQNFFPDMKTNWKLTPNNIGHKESPGCFRCHDGEHVAADRTLKIKSNDCNACHTILSEGQGNEVAELAPLGKPFKHPEEGWEDLSCSDCHDGTVGPDK